MKDRLVLKNGTEIEMEVGARLNAIQVSATDMAAMLSTWEKLTEENLTEVQIKTGEGGSVDHYTGLLLVSETSVINSDRSILTTYNLREKTAEEKRLDALEQGQSVQDGAIEDIAAVTSAIADQVEGGQV